MSSLVIHITITGLPKPMPIVVGIVCVIVINLRGTAPKIPIKVFGRSRNFIKTDATARLTTVAIRNLEAAKLPSTNSFAQPCNPSIRAALCPVLNDNPVFLLSFDTDSSLCNVMAHRLLNVNMLPCLSRPNCHQGVPVIGSGDRNSIEIFVS